MVYLGIPLSENIDHRDRNPANNHFSNLRVCTQAENTRNAGIRSDNTSGICGVAFSVRTGKWLAYINLNGKRKYLGVFDSKEAAAEVRRMQELALHGEFVPTDRMAKAA